MQSVIRFDLETINNERSCTRTNKILKEFSHPNNRQRPLLRLAKRSRSLEANTERMRRSGFLKARNHDILYLSSWTHPLTTHCFTPAVSTKNCTILHNLYTAKTLYTFWTLSAHGQFMFLWPLHSLSLLFILCTWLYSHIFYWNVFSYLVTFIFFFYLLLSVGQLCNTFHYMLFYVPVCFK